MHRDPEYTRAEIEAFVEASRKYDRQALIGVTMVFIVTALIFATLLWGIFMLLPDQQLRIYAAIGLGTAMVIATASYWGYVLYQGLNGSLVSRRGLGNGPMILSARSKKLKHNKSIEYREKRGPDAQKSRAAHFQS